MCVDYATGQPHLKKEIVITLDLESTPVIEIYAKGKSGAKPLILGCFSGQLYQMRKELTLDFYFDTIS